MNSITREYDWFFSNAKNALKTYATHPEKFNGIELTSPPGTFQATDELGLTVYRNELTAEGRFLLMMSLSRYFMDIWKMFFVDGNPFAIRVEGDFAFPTPNTYLMLLCGNDPEKRLNASHNLSGESALFENSIVGTEQKEGQTDFLTSALNMPESVRETLLWNRHKTPRYSIEFPAQQLHTTLEWKDLVLNKHTKNNLLELGVWLEESELMNETLGNSGHFRPGYRCLFYGPSGTGKTLAASLLGKKYNHKVFRIDLSKLVSKYIGETSKNVKRIFDMAEDKDWILFFDEGDALFGKRIDTSTSDNKNVTHSNQDIAFLLQRIERFNGLVIVATNLPKNMDSAFGRRFENRIHFNLPSLDQLIETWHSYWPKNIKLDPAIELEKAFKQYQLTVAALFNIIQRLILIALRDKTDIINAATLNKILMDESYK